jgi:hypothetical protein
VRVTYSVVERIMMMMNSRRRKKRAKRRLEGEGR